PSIERFICVPSQVLLALFAGWLTKANISAFWVLPGATVKLVKVSVWLEPGVASSTVAGVSEGTTIATVAGVAALLVTLMVCAELVSSTSSSFTVPLQGSEKGKELPPAMLTGESVVCAVRVIWVQEAAPFCTGQLAVPKR